MLSLQKSLPKLPVPRLEESLARYLRAVLPLLTSEEYERTKLAVADFLESGIAEKLQAIYEQLAAGSENLVTEWWLDTAYLKNRRPIVPYTNPAFYWPVQNFNDSDDQFRLAAAVIAASLEYRASIVDHTLAPVIVGSKHRPLCMQQYTTMFDSCRVPAPGRDQLLQADFSEPSSQKESAATNVGLLHRNRFYQLTVDNNASDQLQQIFNSLITLKNNGESYAIPVGMLTSWDRDNWSVAHEKLQELNAATLDAIHKCAFIVCLDTKSLPPINEEYSHSSRSFDNVLHGGGSAYNTGNRWFDKTVQFIISHDGIVGFCQEHAPCEALPTAALSDFVWGRVQAAEKLWRHLLPSMNQRDNNLKAMDFRLTPELEQSIATASRAIDDVITDLDTHVQVSSSWGRDDAKKLSICADGLLQIGISVAYYRSHNNTFRSCYETGSTRRFLYGRTDAIRPSAYEVLSLCKELSNEIVDIDRARHLLFKALKAYQEIRDAALSGHSFDRHFLCLKKIARDLNISPLPAFFTDHGYKTSMHHVVCTSQVSSVINGGALGFGPIESDGYGCCYNIGKNKIQFSISAWRSGHDKTDDPRKFGAVLAATLAQLYEIAVSSSSDTENGISSTVPQLCRCQVDRKKDGTGFHTLSVGNNETCLLHS